MTGPDSPPCPNLAASDLIIGVHELNMWKHITTTTTTLFQYNTRNAILTVTLEEKVKGKH